MRITISKTGPPLNHRLWTFIYLICFLLGFCIQGFGESTQTIHRPERFEYRWKVLEDYIRTQQLYWRLYGNKRVEIRQRTEKEEKKKTGGNLVEIPEPQPTPFETCLPLQSRRTRNRQQPRESFASQNISAYSLAHPVWRPNAGRSYRPAPKSSSGKRTLHRPPGAMSA